jgi:hypothetical protein
MSSVTSRFPDYITIQVNVGWIVGWSGEFTFDGYGNDYFGYKGWNAGKSLIPVAGSVTGGWLVPDGRRMVRGRFPYEADLRSFLRGGSHNFSGGKWLGGGVTWNDQGRAFEFGFFVPQVGYAWVESLESPFKSTYPDTTLPPWFY